MAGRRQPPNQPGGQDAASDARVLPHDLNAERALLGAALLSTAALETLATRTRPEDFHDLKNGAIAAALTEAYEQAQQADAVTIAATLIEHGRPDITLPDLFDIQAAAPTLTGAPRYAEIVHDHATRRRMIAAASHIADLGYQPGDVHDAVNRSHAALSDVAANNGSRTYSTLRFADVAAIVAGDLEPISGSFLTRSDGVSLLYAGKIHFFQAEPSTGKSWLALHAATEVLAMGGSVIYLDYEDSDRDIIGRLRNLGVEPAALTERFIYVSPEGPFGVAEKAELDGRINQINPDLIVIDGVAEALVRDGYAEDRNNEVLQWIEKVPRWLARTGAAVVLLDHLRKPQAGETGQRYARGAGAKLGAVDGAAYEIKVIKSFSRHRAGTVRLVVAKDRPGGIGGIGETAAFAQIEPSAAGTIVRIRLDPQAPEGGDSAPWRPTHLMEALSKELEKAAGPIAASALTKLVKGKRDMLSEAVARLQQEGYFIEIRHSGTPLLRSLKPFRADNDPGPDEPPPDDGARDLSDRGLFDDNPGIPADELAERRAQRDRHDPK